MANGLIFYLLLIDENADNFLWDNELTPTKKIYTQIIIASHNAKTKFLKIYNEDIIAYKKKSELINNHDLELQIIKCLKNVINNFSLRRQLFYKLWFPINTQKIMIIVPFDDVRPNDAELTSRNYSLMDNVGDKDAILEIVKLLSKCYPDTDIIINPSNIFDPQNLKNNIVVIGGPGFGKDGNKLCRRIMKKISSIIYYSDDCETMYLRDTDKSFCASSENGIIEKDYGYFGAFPNPFFTGYRIVVIHGIHTLGVVGAAKAFSDEKKAEYNYHVLKTKLNINNDSVIAFQSFFDVEVLEGIPICPKINSDYIFAEKKQEFIEHQKEIGIDQSTLNEIIIHLYSTIAQELLSTPI